MITLKDKIKSLELDCLDNLSLCLEYSTDWKMEKDDYSREYAVYEFLYSYEVYKRALNNKKITGSNLSLIDDSIEDLFNVLKMINFEKRSINFLNNYFSEDRFLSLLNNLDSLAVSENSDTIDKEINFYSPALDYFTIYDRLTLLKNSKILLSNFNLKNLLNEKFDLIKPIFKKHSELWESISEHIEIY